MPVQLSEELNKVIGETQFKAQVTTRSLMAVMVRRASWP